MLVGRSKLQQIKTGGKIMQLENQKGLRGRLGIVLMALMLTVGLTSRAQAVLVDLDGAGGAGAIDIGTLDWGPTSFAAVGGVSAIPSFVSSVGTSPQSSCNFDLLR